MCNSGITIEITVPQLPVDRETSFDITLVVGMDTLAVGIDNLFLILSDETHLPHSFMRCGDSVGFVSMNRRYQLRSVCMEALFELVYLDRRKKPKF